MRVGVSISRSFVRRRIEGSTRQPQTGGTTMRFMMVVKASKESEAGILPTEKELADMARYNEGLVKAGVLLDATGLHPTSKGARVRFAGGKPKVVDGPFAEAKELIAGYWVIQVKSKEEALEWAKRVPFVDGEVEVRQLFELDDFGPGEAVQRHKEIAKEIAKNQ